MPLGHRPDLADGYRRADHSGDELLVQRDQAVLMLLGQRQQSFQVGLGILEVLWTQALSAGDTKGKVRPFVGGVAGAFNANYVLCGRAFNRNMAAASRAKTWTRRPRKERTLLAHSMPVFS